jgi:hypothetical protein
MLAGLLSAREHEALAGKTRWAASSGQQQILL